MVGIVHYYRLFFSLCSLIKIFKVKKVGKKTYTRAKFLHYKSTRACTCTYARTHAHSHAQILTVFWIHVWNFASAMGFVCCSEVLLVWSLSGDCNTYGDGHMQWKWLLPNKRVSTLIPKQTKNYAVAAQQNSLSYKMLNVQSAEGDKMWLWKFDVSGSDVYCNSVLLGFLWAELQDRLLVTVCCVWGWCM